MAKPLTPRQKLAGVRMCLSKPAGFAPGKKSAPSREIEKLAMALLPSVKMAFAEAGLDFDKGSDWDLLLLFLAFAVYGKGRAGAPKKWTQKKYRRLVEDVRALQQDKNQKLSETTVCAMLIEGKVAEGRYKGRKGAASTLRRALQRAKKIAGHGTPLKGAVDRPASAKSAVENPSDQSAATFPLGALTEGENERR